MRQAKHHFAVLVTSVLICPPGIALADDDERRHSVTRLVDCSRGHSIQDALDRKNPDRPLTLLLRGACHGNVSVTRDDVTLLSDPPRSATVNGTISVVGARRVLISGLIVTNPGGDGIFGVDNAAITVEDSTIEGNGREGVHVRSGAHANLRRNVIQRNGVAAMPDSGRGIQATHNGSVNAEGNTIVDNHSDGVGVFNGSYARLVENTIERNGRVAAGEAGVQVSRARVRGGGNIIRNNTGQAAVLVVNHGDYRTGTALNAVDFPQNEFRFEEISHPADSGRVAIEVNNNAYGDFRQVDISGSVTVGAMSMMLVRGDEIGPDLRCSSVKVPAGGALLVNSRGFLRVRYTQVMAPAIPPNTEFQIPLCPVAPAAP